MNIVTLAPNPVELVHPANVIQEVCLKDWYINNVKVSLLRKGDAFSYKVDNSPRITVGPIALLPNCSADQTAEYLKSCEAILNTNGTPFFSPVYLSYSFDYIPDKIRHMTRKLVEKKNRKVVKIDVKLLRGSIDLIWQSFQSDTKETLYLPFTSSKLCTKNFYNFSEKQEAQFLASLKDKTSTIMEDYRLQSYKKTKESSGKQAFQVWIGPNSEPSRLDKRVLISKNAWVVTLITTEDCCGQHSKIIIEGILQEGCLKGSFKDDVEKTTLKIGDYFTYFIYFNGKLKYNFLSEDVLGCPLLKCKRTRLWKRSALKILKMIEVIQDQEKRKRTKFAYTGSDSLLNLFSSNAHNCFSYARTNLQNHLGIIIKDKLESKPQDYLIDRFMRQPSRFVMEKEFFDKAKTIEDAQVTEFFPDS